MQAVEQAGGLVFSWLYVAVGFLGAWMMKRDRENAETLAFPIDGHVFPLRINPRPCPICTNLRLATVQ